MIPYILYVALLISVCLIFYKVLLQKETFYRLNRFILISSLALSFVIPLVPVPQQWTFRKTQETADVNKPIVNSPITVGDQPEKKPVVNPPVSNTLPTTSNAAAHTATDTLPAWPVILKWVFYLYWIGVTVFAINFLLQMTVLLYRAWSATTIKDGRFRIVELKGDKAPCSFANYIFINPAQYDWDTYNQILLHEKIHIRQYHSLDIILAELVVVFQWFNPFAWMYRRELENNLEFLTDNSVLHNDGVEKESYQISLLKVSAPHFSLGLTTNYNQSLLKKRIAMMNAKQSNLNTMWKYLFLLPLVGCLMFALNDTVAFGQNATPKKNSRSTSNKDHTINDRTSGSWFATIKNEKVRIQFRSDEDNDNWGSNSDFLVSEFSALPIDKAGEFTLTREAGTILFKGKFDGDKGYGAYYFTASKDYANFLSKEGITGAEEDDAFAFFLLNVKKDYVTMLKENGYKDISKDELISLTALKVDAAFIQMWKQNGFDNLSTNDLVSAKALGIDKEYVADIRKAGYEKIDFNQLISFKAQRINGDYINSLRKSKNAAGDKLPDADQVTAYKAMDIDANFIKSFEAAGYKNIEYDDLTAMKATGVTPEFVKGFEAIGYKNIPVQELISLKSLNITPVFVKGFANAGYKDIPVNELASLKSLDVTPEFIKSFQSLGFSDLSLENMTAAKSMGLTPEFVKRFKAIGLSGNNLSNYIPLKALDITPGYVNGFKKLGFTNISLEELPALKSMGVTPEYINAMQEKGIKLNSLDKYIQLKSVVNQ
jgi:BlaR1 peptidase M56